MFTGIVTDIGEVVTIRQRAEGLYRLKIACSYKRASIVEGASIACSGVCMTVVGIGEDDGHTWFAVEAAAETLRTIEAREQELVDAEADIERRKLGVAEMEREAEAAKQARADEAERVRIASADLAARERALAEAQAELARRTEPPPVPAGFRAGLEALASASQERRARKQGR